MNPKSLEALIIDRSFGELSPEAAELLETFLDTHPEAHAMVARIEAALATTESAVSKHPELFSARQLAGSQEAAPENVIPLPAAVWLRAVAAVALLALVGASGYLAGHRSHSPEPTLSGQRSPTLLSSATPSPWAQYRITSAGIEASIPNPPSGQ